MGVCYTGALGPKSVEVHGPLGVRVLRSVGLRGTWRGSWGFEQLYGIPGLGQGRVP